MSAVTEAPPPGPWAALERAARASFPEAAQAGVWLSVALLLGAAAVSAFHLWSNLAARLDALTMGVAHFALLGMLGVLAAAQPPAVSGRGWVIERLGLCAVIAAVGAGVVALEEPLYAGGLRFNIGHWLASAGAVVLATELTRRTAGLVIPVLVFVALTYATVWGSWIGGVFAFPGLSWETMLFRSVYTDEGMFGSIAAISWSYVFVFVLFGTFLVRSGAAELILILARAAAGRVTGGPGLVAVASSGLMGSVTGSAVANAVATGSVTIPLMKRAGFSARFAAGTEAAASTGGQLMPPVMGAGAFLMANFTGLPYLEIIAAAFVPALLYFLSVGFHVRIEALRQGIVAEGAQHAVGGEPPGRVLLRTWPLLAPLVVLVILLVLGFTPVYAGAGAIAAVIACSWLTPRRMGPAEVLEALAVGARAMVPTAMLLVTVGLVVNVITTTGAGGTFSLMITEWAGASLLVTIVLVALASLVLGMGLPVTAAYIVLAAIAAPTLHGLLTQTELVAALARGEVTPMAMEALTLARPEAATVLGMPMPEAQARELVMMLTPELQRTLVGDVLDPAVVAGSLLAAHMLVFWLSQDSNVTPPVSLAAFAAAGIAATRPLPAGVTAWKLAKGLYIIPVLFAYTALLTGSWLEVLPVALLAAAGLYAFAGALEGYLEGPLGVTGRMLSALSAGLLLWPMPGAALSVAGLVLLAAAVLASRRGRHAR